MSQQFILFDINETVLNLAPLKPKFKQYFRDESLLATWFSMLLHSSTVCLTTNTKTNFKDLAQANLYSLAGRLTINLTADEASDILNTLASLPAHDDIQPALKKLRRAGFKLVAFSNSSNSLLKSQLEHAKLIDYFDDIISVESANTFKPSSHAYLYATEYLKSPANCVTLVAAHDWDTHGALSSGLKAAFIDRFQAPYNPIYKKPSLVGRSMIDIADKLIEDN